MTPKPDSLPDGKLRGHGTGDRSTNNNAVDKSTRDDGQQVMTPKNPLFLDDVSLAFSCLSTQIDDSSWYVPCFLPTKHHILSICIFLTMYLPRCCQPFRVYLSMELFITIKPILPSFEGRPRFLERLSTSFHTIFPFFVISRVSSFFYFFFLVFSLSLFFSFRPLEKKIRLSSQFHLPVDLVLSVFPSFVMSGVSSFCLFICLFFPSSPPSEKKIRLSRVIFPSIWSYPSNSNKGRGRVFYTPKTIERLKRSYYW